MRSKFARTAGVLVAMLALSVVAAASASAHSFTVSKTGNLRGAGGIFEIQGPGVSGLTRCFSQKSKGEAKEGLQSILKVTVEYSGCELFQGTVGFPVTVTNGEYEFSAEGKPSLLKAISVYLYYGPVEVCHFTLEPVSNAGLAKYTNTGEHLTTLARVRPVAYKSTGGPCGGSGTNATLEMSLPIEVEGGTIKWE